MARSLADRLRAHEQQKARLADQEARLRTAERRARTRQLIEAGGLLAKAGLLCLDVDALCGALVSLRDGASDKTQVEQWAALGGRAFAREARQRNEGAEPIVMIFPAALDREATSALRRYGFRFNRVLQHWEGLARHENAEQLVAALGGTMQRIAASRSVAAVPARDAAPE